MSNSLICGRMKQGKTTLGIYLCRQHSIGVVAWDPRNMIDGVICWGPDELEEAIEKKRWKEGPLVYRFDSTDVNTEFSNLCRVIFPPRFTLHKFSFLVDEAAQLQTSHSVHPDLHRAVTQHPRDVLVVQTTHSLQDWARSSKDLTDSLYCFQLRGNSLKAVVDYCDGGQKMEAVIKGLKDHQVLHWSHATDSYEVWADPSRWFYPLNSASKAERGMVVQ